MKIEQERKLESVGRAPRLWGSKGIEGDSGGALCKVGGRPPSYHSFGSSSEGGDSEGDEGGKVMEGRGAWGRNGQSNWKCRGDEDGSPPMVRESSGVGGSMEMGNGRGFGERGREERDWGERREMDERVRVRRQWRPYLRNPVHRVSSSQQQADKARGLDTNFISSQDEGGDAEGGLGARIRGARKCGGGSRSVSPGSSPARFPPPHDQQSLELGSPLPSRRRVMVFEDSCSGGAWTPGWTNTSFSSRQVADSYLMGLKTMESQSAELPLKIAYQHLEELTENADRVKSAIDQNRRLLHAQVCKATLRMLRKTFGAWRTHMQTHAKRTRQLWRVTSRMARARLWRAFFAWKHHHVVITRVGRMESSARRVLNRRFLSRVWAVWLELVYRRLQQKNDEREKRRLVKDLDDKRREGIFRRAMNVMLKNRLARAFYALKEGAEKRREKRARLCWVSLHLTKYRLIRAFSGWVALFSMMRDRQAFLRKVTGRMRSYGAARSFGAWFCITMERRRQQLFIRRCASKMMKRALAMTFYSWLAFIDFKIGKRRHLRGILTKLKKSRLSKALSGWVCLHMETQRLRIVMHSSFSHMLKFKLRKAFQNWVLCMQLKAEERFEELQEQCTSVQLDMQKVKAENERLIRIIDSGEWSRDRLGEIVKAGEVLSGERDALTKLLGRLKREHMVAQGVKMRQADKVDFLKEQMLSGNFVQRNKLLVKGASSLNSMVRVLKSDVLGREIMDPELLYDVDRLAMDQVKVSVFPDGDIHVQPVCMPDTLISQHAGGRTGQHRMAVAASHHKFHSVTTTPDFSTHQSMLQLDTHSASANALARSRIYTHGRIRAPDTATARSPCGIQMQALHDGSARKPHPHHHENYVQSRGADNWAGGQGSSGDGGSHAHVVARWRQDMTNNHSD